MKRIQQYCSVTDRLEQDPACKEEVLKMALQPKIHMTKRGMITGSAVAAALLALNIGIGGYLYAQNKAREELLSAANDELSVAEADDLPETTAAVTGTSLSAAAETVRLTATTAKTTSAAAQSSTQKTTKTAAVSQTAEKQTAEKPAAGQTASAAQNDAGTGTGTSAQTTSPAPKSSVIEYALVPADKPYETTGGKSVWHVKPGEQYNVRLTVQNDPGVSGFMVEYNISKNDLLSRTNLQHYEGSVHAYGQFDAVNNDDQILVISGNGDGSTKAPDGAALAEFTLIAPSTPGTYEICPYSNRDSSYVVNEDGTTTVLPSRASFAEKNGEDCACTVRGAEIIVDADETASSGYLVDPETLDGPTVYFEPVTAHAGEKHVPVKLRVKGNDPFISGFLSFDYDPALQPLLFNRDTMDNTTASEDDRLGISVEGTLLENAPLLKSSVSIGSKMYVIFNNYRSFGYDSDGLPTVFHNGETQTDAVIAEEGVLCTLYFDMPEECGTYRIYPYDGQLGGGAQDEPGNLPDQTIQNFIPLDIVVIP